MRRALLVSLSLILLAVLVAAISERPPPARGGLRHVRTAMVSTHVAYELTGLNDAAQAELSRRAGAWYAWAAAHPPPAPPHVHPAAPRTSSSPPPAERRTAVDWDGIAQCETGGNWSHLGRAPGGSTYDGGLGIYHGAWTDFGGLEFAPRGDLATKAEQIVVAERIYARHGLSGWGCKAYG